MVFFSGQRLKENVGIVSKLIYSKLALYHHRMALRPVCMQDVATKKVLRLLFSSPVISLLVCFLTLTENMWNYNPAPGNQLKVSIIYEGTRLVRTSLDPEIPEIEIFYL